MKLKEIEILKVPTIVTGLENCSETFQFPSSSDSNGTLYWIS